VVRAEAGEDRMARVEFRGRKFEEKKSWPFYLRPRK
jgi:hypothetical protein